MKHIIIESTDCFDFLDKLNTFTNRKDKLIINIAYSTNTIQTVEIISRFDMKATRKEIVKTNYSALIQYT